MLHKFRLLAFALAVLFALPGAGLAANDPNGLSPSSDMTFLPHLAGLRNKVYKNQLGQKKSLSEAIVLRGSDIKDGKAAIQPGGLFYVSETSHDAAPFRRDPFLLLGEHAYLVGLKTAKHTFRDVALKKGDRKPLGDTGYRLWFDYSTDHFDKPYGEFAVISPSGGFPLEFPISTTHAKREEVRNIHLKEGLNPQLDKFYLDNTYYFGASKYVAKKVGFDGAEFESIEFPEITEATFSLQRPITLEVRQEDYRFYLNKRIYAFRRPDGFLVRVTDFTGGRVYAEKLVKPTTAQEYKTRMDEQDKYNLTIPELDLRVEIVVDPAFLKDSDFVPWSTSKAHGFSSGNFSFVVYRDLVTVKNGRAWPLDDRYDVVLEPNLETGMLHRVLLENNEPITLDNDHDSYEGPVKYSDVYNRHAFKVVANGFDKDVVRNLYVRDYYFMRTDNMVMWPEEGNRSLDFFLGSSPVLEPIIERSFLTRLADSSYGTVVEESRFTSYPKAVSDASFYEPDHTAPFVPRLKGLMRKLSRNRKKERLLSAEAIVIRRTGRPSRRTLAAVLEDGPVFLQDPSQHGDVAAVRVLAIASDGEVGGRGKCGQQGQKPGFVRGGKLLAVFFGEAGPLLVGPDALSQFHQFGRRRGLGQPGVVEIPRGIVAFFDPARRPPDGPYPYPFVFLPGRAQPYHQNGHEASFCLVSLRGEQHGDHRENQQRGHAYVEGREPLPVAEKAVDRRPRQRPYADGRYVHHRKEQYGFQQRGDGRARQHVRDVDDDRHGPRLGIDPLEERGLDEPDRLRHPVLRLAHRPAARDLHRQPEHVGRARRAQRAMHGRMLLQDMAQPHAHEKDHEEKAEADPQEKRQGAGETEVRPGREQQDVGGAGRDGHDQGKARQGQDCFGRHGFSFECISSSRPAHFDIVAGR